MSNIYVPLSGKIHIFSQRNVTMLKYKLGIVYNMQYMCHITFLKSKNISKFQNTSDPWVLDKSLGSVVASKSVSEFPFTIFLVENRELYRMCN